MSEDTADKNKLSRRDFLTKAGKGGLAAGATMLGIKVASDALSSLGSQPDVINANVFLDHDKNTKLIGILTKEHPEVLRGKFLSFSIGVSNPGTESATFIVSENKIGPNRLFMLSGDRASELILERTKNAKGEDLAVWNASVLGVSGKEKRRILERRVTNEKKGDFIFHSQNQSGREESYTISASQFPPDVLGLL